MGAGVRHLIRTVGLAGLALLLCSSPIYPQPLTKVKLSYPSVSGITENPFWLAQDGGLFKRQGLDAVLLFIEGGVTSVQALIGGDVQYNVGDPTVAYTAILRGLDLVFLASHHNVLPYRIATSKEVTTVAQLRGKLVGISRIGGRSGIIANLMLKGAGLDPRKDVNFVQIGGSAARFSALSVGRIQGAPISFSQEPRARRAGLNVLKLPEAPFFNASLVSTRAYVDKQPDLVRRFLRAYVEGIHFFLTRKAETLRIMSKYMRNDNLKDVEFTYDIILPHMQRKPFPPDAAIRETLQMMIQEDSRVAALQPEKSLELRFLRELDESGFIDGLYKR